MAYRKDLIITIDGPSGAGKSTIARKLSQRLGYTFVDTGAMYRAVAFAYRGLTKMQAGQSPGCRAETADRGGFTSDSIGRGNPAITAEQLKGLPIGFEFAGGTKVYLNGKDISKEIRDPEISLMASTLSQQRTVREYLYTLQREIGKDGGVVLEGRDTGSVVFPEAHLKFYLDADPDERARRRHLELSAKGMADVLSKVKEDMIERDRNDSERSIAPLVVPTDAIRVDTSGIGVDGVVRVLLEHVALKGTA